MLFIPATSIALAVIASLCFLCHLVVVTSGGSAATANRFMAAGIAFGFLMCAVAWRSLEVAS